MATSSEDPRSKEDEGLFQLQMAVAIDQAQYPLEEVIEGYTIALQQIEPRGDMTEAVLQVKFRLRELLDGETSFYRMTQTNQGIFPSSAQMLFSLQKPILLFYVQSNENVIKEDFVHCVYIYQFEDIPEDAPTFLQVSSWIFPLVRGKSSIFKSPNGNYMFSSFDRLGSDAVGLIFSKDVRKEEKLRFSNLLNELISPLGSIAECKKFSSQMSSSLVEGAEAVGVGMVRGAIQTSAAFHWASEKINESITPEMEPQVVDPGIKATLEAAHWVSEKGVKATGFLLSKVGAGTLALGKFLAPHVKKQSIKALSQLQHQPEEECQKQYDIASDVVGGTVAAVSTLYTALENSTKVIAKNAANSTVKVVTHKYGVDVGDATNNALSAVGNTYMTVYNAGALTVKGVAKRTVKDTSKLSMNVSEDVITGRLDPLRVLDETDEEELEDKSNQNV